MPYTRAEQLEAAVNTLELQGASLEKIQAGIQRAIHQISGDTGYSLSREGVEQLQQAIGNGQADITQVKAIATKELGIALTAHKPLPSSAFNNVGEEGEMASSS